VNAVPSGLTAPPSYSTCKLKPPGAAAAETATGILDEVARDAASTAEDIATAAAIAAATAHISDAFTGCL
jgi:hypothetical protein